MVTKGDTRSLDNGSHAGAAKAVLWVKGSGGTEKISCIWDWMRGSGWDNLPTVEFISAVGSTW